MPKGAKQLFVCTLLLAGIVAAWLAFGQDKGATPDSEQHPVASAAPSASTAPVAELSEIEQKLKASTKAEQAEALSSNYKKAFLASDLPFIASPGSMEIAEDTLVQSGTTATVEASAKGEGEEVPKIVLMLTKENGHWLVFQIGPK